VLQNPDEEQKFSTRLKQEIDKIEVPDFQKVWDGIKKCHYQERSKKQRKLFLQVAVVFLCIISVVSMIRPDFVTALSSRVEKIVLQRQDGTMEVRTKIAREDVVRAKTNPPPDLVEPEQEQYTVGFAEAQEMTPFHLTYPEYIPEGYECKEVQIIKFDQHYHIVELFQKGDDYFSIQQRNVLGEMASTRGFPSDVIITELEIMGHSATLVKFPEGNLKTVLFWDAPDMQWEIMATASAEEVIKVAKSLK
jgi:hypothetical protein